MHESVVTATAGIGRLGRADRDSSVALRHELSEAGATDTLEFILILGIDIANIMEQR